MLHTVAAAPKSSPFAHSPIPPTVPADYPAQRYFHGTTDRRHVGDQDQVCGFSAQTRVYRSAVQDAAEVSIFTRSARGRFEATLELSPRELRELAQRLLDAAHDIETAPAEVLARAAA